MAKDIFTRYLHSENKLANLMKDLGVLKVFISALSVEWPNTFPCKVGSHHVGMFLSHVARDETELTRPGGFLAFIVMSRPHPRSPHHGHGHGHGVFIYLSSY